MSSGKSEILHFDGLLLSKSCTVSAKKVQKSFPWHWRVMKSLKKNWLAVSNMTRNLVNFHPATPILKISLRWALFVQSIKVWDKKYSKQRCKIWVNLDLVVSKLAWGIGCTFIKALKNLKICTFMGSFCPKCNWRENWLVA